MLRIFALLALFLANIITAQETTKFVKMTSISISHEYYVNHTPPYSLTLLDHTDQVMFREMHGETVFYLPEGAAWPASLTLVLSGHSYEALDVTLFNEQRIQALPFLGVREPFSDEISFYENNETTIELLDFSPILSVHKNAILNESALALVRLSLTPDNTEKVFIRLTIIPVVIEYCLSLNEEHHNKAPDINITDIRKTTTFTRHASEQCDLLFRASEEIKLRDHDDGRFVMTINDPSTELVLPSPRPSPLEFVDGKYVARVYMHL